MRSYASWRPAALCAIALTFVGCQATTDDPATHRLDPSPSVATELPGPSTGPFPGLAFTFNGEPIDTRFAMLIDAPEHCGIPRVQLLTVGHPFGRGLRTDKDAIQFVRDPDHLVEDRTADSFSPSTDLPAGAYFTGLAYDDLEVWAADDVLATAIFVVRGEVIERWPRALELIACA